MSSYHVLEEDRDWKFLASLGEADPGHDIKWLMGRPFEYGEQPRDLVVELEERRRSYPDFFELLRAPVVSYRFKGALDSIGVDNVDYYPTLLREPRGRCVQGYYVINVVGRIACVDRAASRFTMVDDQLIRMQSLVIDPQAASGARVFRLHEYPEIIVVDAGVADAVKSLVGLTLRPADGWSDAHRF
ncbi:imm11 family protein [Sorangium sp. So ce1182]|uniref:imm11 family protein n=1 Tax=Sorangium sp. So ce1182 TaxID=3133334 RepID=UPI003F61A02D